MPRTEHSYKEEEGANSVKSYWEGMCDNQGEVGSGQAEGDGGCSAWVQGPGGSLVQSPGSCRAASLTVGSSSVKKGQ